jgi:hypothetical protein
MATDFKTLNEETNQLAEKLFGNDVKKRTAFASRLMDTCSLVSDKDFLLIHNPGGWGSTDLEGLLQWERSILDGVSAAVKNLGYSCAFMQYFRSNQGWPAVVEDIGEQTRFFTTKAKIMAAELEFVTRHFSGLQVIMIGVSQGGAFSNAVSQRLNGLNHVVSIEMGLPFYYMSRRVITERTLAIDGNGQIPDNLMECNVPVIISTYLKAPFRWIKYRLQGKHIKFTYCINVPGHDYNWDYPGVHERIENFLKNTFGNKVVGGKKK